MSSEFESDFLDWALFRLDHIEGDKQNEFRAEDDHEFNYPSLIMLNRVLMKVISRLSRQPTG